jgi:hypothetical protein
MTRAPAKNFQDLIVWQKGHSFVLAIYQMSKAFPNYEVYGLTSQLRRAAISVPANSLRKNQTGKKEVSEYRPRFPGRMSLLLDLGPRS